MANKIRKSVRPASRKNKTKLKQKPIKKNASVLADIPLPRMVEEEILLVSALAKMEEDFEDSLRRPKVSVVIVNCDGVDFLWHCLFALKTQTYPPAEIILVDNGSADASISFVRENYPQVKILECQENFGFAMGSNLGARCATGDLVALLNNDAVVTPEWLGRLVRQIQEQWPKVGAVSSQLKTNQGKQGNREVDREVLNILGEKVEGFLEDPQELFYPEGAAFVYARFLAPDGPFDPDYFIFQEDMYLGWKLRLAGRKTQKSLDAKVFHEEGGTVSLLPGWKVVYYQIRNRWLNLFFFYDAGNFLKVLPWLILEAFGRLVQGLGSGFDRFFGTLMAGVWILFHFGTIYGKRMDIQKKRKVSDREILRVVSGRVIRDGKWMSRVLNLVSLAYCRFVGLEVIEFRVDV